MSLYYNDSIALVLSNKRAKDTSFGSFLFRDNLFSLRPEEATPLDRKLVTALPLPAATFASGNERVPSDSSRSRLGHARLAQLLHRIEPRSLPGLTSDGKSALIYRDCFGWHSPTQTLRTAI